MNRVISVLGDSTGPQLIIDGIRKKHFPAPSKSNPFLSTLARKLIDWGYVQDAEALVRQLGGRVERKEKWLVSLPIALYLDETTIKFMSDNKMARWVRTTVAPKYV